MMRLHVLQSALRTSFAYALLALATAACGDTAPESASLVESAGGAGIRTSTLEAGPPLPELLQVNLFEGDEREIAEGERLYHWMNCAGCHGPKGGGGIGPPLADSDWIYGGGSEHIYQAIMQGRPNGMPTYRGKLTEASAWRIAAYVRSLSEEQADESGGSPQGPSAQGAEEGNRR